MFCMYLSYATWYIVRELEELIDFFKGRDLLMVWLSATPKLISRDLWKYGHQCQYGVSSGISRRGGGGLLVRGNQPILSRIG